MKIISTQEKMIKLNETPKKAFIKPNSLALIAVFLILILFLINNNTHSSENRVNTNFIELNDNLFKCYELVKNSTVYFKSIGKNKPNLNKLKTYLNTNQINTDLILGNEWLVDHYYNDINEQYITNNIKFINNSIIRNIQYLVKNNLKYNMFDDTMLAKIIQTHFKKNTFNKIGILNWFERDYFPWLEALLMMNSLTKRSNIVNIDLHTNKIYESPQIKAINLNNFLSDNLNSYLNNVYILNDYKFDAFISYDGVESIGLGKYGENLWLDADFEYVNLINCMLKPQGLFVLTLSVTSQEISYLEFNTKRVYGIHRLNKLLLNNNWVLLERLKYNHGKQEVFVLKKNA